jgi:hypothetical protein
VKYPLQRNKTHALSSSETIFYLLIQREGNIEEIRNHRVVCGGGKRVRERIVERIPFEVDYKCEALRDTGHLRSEGGGESRCQWGSTYNPTLGIDGGFNYAKIGDIYPYPESSVTQVTFLLRPLPAGHVEKKRDRLSPHTQVPVVEIQSKNTCVDVGEYLV